MEKTVEDDNIYYIQYKTYKKWKRDLDKKKIKTVTWLECETVMECGRKMVRALKCSICSKYIESSRNFSDKWIVGAELLCTSNIQDHGKNQHVLVMSLMSLLAKEHATNHGEGPSTYAPIVQVLTRLSESEKARLKRKFDIAYLIATEGMSYSVTHRNL